MKKYITFAFLLFLMSCSSSKVVYDYDVKTNFNAYKTFHFFEDVGVGLNDLDVDRLISAIEKQLMQLGFEKSESPDFYINFSGIKNELANNETVSVGIGNSGGNIGLGIFGDILIGRKKVQEKLTIDFIDSKKDQLIWQGISTATIREQVTPQKREEYFKQIVQKILSKYPPKKY